MPADRLDWQKIFTPTAVDEAENESAGSAGQRWWQGSSSFDFRREERQLELAQREVKPGMAPPVCRICPRRRVPERLRLP